MDATTAALLDRIHALEAFMAVVVNALDEEARPGLIDRMETYAAEVRDSVDPDYHGRDKQIGETMLTLLAGIREGRRQLGSESPPH